ncbi:hypothetical protein [Azospirillum canadense]|uniref:hypothetical protein n=1 Tax=Azospirillum canadense TaxID=403962 RepID=UPI002227DD49|nr:hypothetical protein [Azospirillum canadense]MCW2243943.1 hypothetical protein [Azospirillum canadense]
MTKSFIITPLSPSHADQALPVAQALHRDMTLEQWRGAVAPFLESGPNGSCGAMACAMSDGHIRGLYCWRVSADSAVRVLTVPIFVAIGLFDAAATSAAQIESIDHLARQLGCGTVVVDLRGCVVAATAPKLDAEGLFTRLGYRLIGEALVREVGAGSAAFATAGAA